MNKQLNLKWVSEAIGESYKNWKKGDIIKIQAQTGTGKTFFITGDKDKEGLIDRLDSWERIIYICNRKELKKQIKLDLLKKFNMEIPCIKDKDGNYILNKKNERQIDTDALEHITTIQNVVVTSYHALAYGKLDNIYNGTNNNLDNFDYIICDECHFFMTDAGYNNKSYLALEELVNTRHRNAIKIFISATMDEMEKVIEAQAKRHKEIGFGDYKNFTLHPPITTGIDYSYLDISYFKKVKDIIQLIKNDETDEKWMFFVTSKKIGEDIDQKLKDFKINSVFIHAESNNNEKKRITTNYGFKSKVLICTKCLDNGINIKDDKVKNMVIMAYDKTTFIQELGRRRFKIENAPTIKLYIPMLKSTVFSGKIEKNYKPKIDTLELFWKDKEEFKKKYNNDLDKSPKDIFYLDKNNNWTINNLGLGRVYKDNAFAINMAEKFKYDKFAFIKEQLKWLGLEDTFNRFNLIVDTVDTEEVHNLEDFLEGHIGQRLYDEEQQELSNLIIKELTTISKDVDYRTKKLKPTTLENILRVQLELPYVVSDSKKESKGINRGKRYIIITKIK